MNWEQIDWHQAVERAAGRRIVLKVGASWCTMCEQLDREVLDTSAVTSILAETFCVYADFDEGASRALVERFAILDLPTVIVIEDDREWARVVGYYEAQGWIKQMREALNGPEALPRLEEEYARRSDVPDAALELGEALLSRDPDRGLALLEGVTFEEGDVAADALWTLGRYYQRVLRKPEPARFIWQQLAERFADHELAADAWWWYATAQAERGRVNLGSMALQRRADRVPGDPHALAEWVRFAGRYGYEPAREGIRTRALEALTRARGAARDEFETLVMNISTPFRREEP